MLWEACNKLRGGVEPARYKDYVLVLLFHKYVSERYESQEPFSVFKVTPETSFDALTKAKGKSDIGERVDIIIRKFMEDNDLQGSLPDVSFNNTERLIEQLIIADVLGCARTFKVEDTCAFTKP